MFKRFSSLLFASSCALTLVACGGDDGFSKASEAFKASIQAGCQKAFDCMSSYDPAMHNGTAFADSYGTSVDNCVTQTLAFIDQFLPGYMAKLDASVAAGRIDFNGADAEACINAGKSQTCDQFFEQNGATYTAPASCNTAMVGTVATGGMCTIEDDCAVDSDNCDDTTMTCTAG